MTPRPPCEVCGMGAHRYGTTDPEHDYNAMGCVNMLLPELERLRSILAAESPRIYKRSLSGHT